MCLISALAGPSEPSAQVSLSPPFVLSLSVAQTGLVACGLADGRAWLGSGGEKFSSSEGSSTARKKKRRKWHGLRIDYGEYFKIAEGPIIAVCVMLSGNTHTIEASSSHAQFIFLVNPTLNLDPTWHLDIT